VDSLKFHGDGLQVMDALGLAGSIQHPINYPEKEEKE
jgi:hypothetical protein